MELDEAMEKHLVWTMGGLHYVGPPEGVTIQVPTGKTDQPPQAAEQFAPSTPAWVSATPRKTTRPGLSFGSTTTVRYAVSAINSYGESLPRHLDEARHSGHTYEIVVTIARTEHAVGYRIYRMDGERFRTPLLFIGSVPQPITGDAQFIDRNGHPPGAFRTWRLKADDYLFKFGQEPAVVAATNEGRER